VVTTSASATRVACDVLIVGAGAAGSLLAQRLAAAGRGVTVLEAGPAWTMGDLVSSHIWAKRLRWGGRPPVTDGPHPIGTGFNLGWGLGGAALHHYGNWPRMRESDFRLRSATGEGVDWPIAYADLRPHYDKLQAEVGLSGDAERELTRPPADPYPLPPLPPTRQSKVVRRGFEALGLPVGPSGVAILSRDYGDRPACIYDGWCDAGCPTGALANPLAIWIPQAEALGARFLTGVTARFIEAQGRRAVAVLADGPAGRTRFDARTVVVACAPVHSAALLLASAQEGHAAGLGNGHDLVGRRIMTHPAVQVFGLFEDETEPHLGISGGPETSFAGYAKDRVAGSVGGWQMFVGGALKPNDITGLAFARPELRGPALAAFMQRAARHLGNVLGMCEGLPHADNRVTLGEGGQPRITHADAPGTVRLWEAMRDEAAAIIRAAGAPEAFVSPRLSAHIMGGTPMGATEQEGVTDSHGRVWGLDNLFVAGSGLFPTGGAVNPTYTILALADRAAPAIAAAR
jgi:choline dehydrogenase-like flavoprotein